MRHYPVGSGNNRHYAVGHNGQGGVLLQLGEDISVEPFHCQVRVCLTVMEADELIELLQKAKVKAVQELMAKAVKHEGSQPETRSQESVEVSCVPGIDGQGQEAVQDVQA